MGLIIRIVLILLFSCSLAACGQNPDCGSTETTNLVIQSVSKQEANLLPMISTIVAKSPQGQRYNNSLNAEDALAVSATGGPVPFCFTLRGIPEKDTPLCQELRENLKSSRTDYAVDTIRTINVEPNTKMVQCGARLHMTIADWGSAEQDITYTAQNTSDGMSKYPA
jgi:hypothetical protein